KCEIKDFRIYVSKATLLNVKFELENYDIKFNYNYLNISIHECKEEQIKIFKNKIFYCEIPRCEDDCPVNDNKAICMKGEDINSNDIKNNHCECLQGWIGSKCQNRNYEDLR
ncbi:hypothetical protein BCR36DRAFT_280965, partial [Piromyces finnis]